MKRFLVIALVLGLAISALAAGAKNLTIGSDATVNGAKLVKGEYKVVVDGNGPEVKVNFLQNGKVIATAPGKMVDSGSAPEFSAVVIDKTAKVQELRIAGLKSKIVFNQ
jgi:hypothetical protein